MLTTTQKLLKKADQLQSEFFLGHGETAEEEYENFCLARVTLPESLGGETLVFEAQSTGLPFEEWDSWVYMAPTLEEWRAMYKPDPYCKMSIYTKADWEAMGQEYRG